MKLQRAEDLWGQLRQEHEQFINRNPYRVLREDDPDRGEGYFLWRVKIVEHPPYEKWASLVRECAHALRSALDHTAYALVNREGLVNEFSAFPILCDSTQWSSRKGKDLPDLPGEALTLIEQMQPYQLRDDYPTDPLRIVHRLDVIDKHRRLSLVDSTVHGTVWHAIRGELEEPEEYGLGPFKDGAIVGRFRARPKPPDTEVAIATQFTFGISMGSGEPGQGKLAIQLLEDLRSCVGGTIAQFDRFFD